MKTSWRETEKIEQYLFKKLPEDEQLLFQAGLILNSNLKDNVNWQKLTYEIIRANGRKKLKTELTMIHESLFSESRFTTFRKLIHSLFTSQS
jgi:hypothetical protein